jgi:outer membrane protein OmpA-like peptidoglycan-associated protein
MSDEHDRDAIMARRAILLAGALAAVHCAAPSPNGTGSSGNDGSGRPQSSGTSGPSNQPPTSDFKPLALPPFSELLTGFPPTSVPASLPDGLAKYALVGHEHAVKAELAQYEAVWNAFPSCAASEPDCRAKYRELSEKAKPLFDRRGIFGGFGCGSYAGETGTLNARKMRANVFLQKLQAQIEEQFEALAKAQSPSGEQEWRKLLAGAKVQPPMPCLSPCPMPEVSPLTMNVLFSEGSDKLDHTRDIELAVNLWKGNRKPAKIIVRGHRNSSESAKLALARAKNVAAALEKAGVAKKDLVVISLEDTLPVEHADSPEKAQNQRVDFDLEPASPN